MLALTSLIVLRDGLGRLAWRQAVSLAICSLGTAGFLAVNAAPGFIQPSGAGLMIANALAGWAAVFLWVFVQTIYEDGFRFDAPTCIVMAAWMILSLGEYFPAGWQTPNAVMLAFGLGLVAHLVWVLIADREDDLRSGRRLSRTWIAGGLILLLLADLVVDATLGTAWRPEAFLVGQNIAIAVIVVGIASIFLQASASLAYTGRRAEPTPQAASPHVRDLLALMEDEALYLDLQLRLSDVARKLRLPEVEVRALIRDSLGYGHFRNFLNSYRVAHAKALLSDPKREGEKIVAIGFDSGFASLPSFQRVFKRETGLPPGAWRRAVRAGKAAAGE